MLKVLLNTGHTIAGIIIVKLKESYNSHYKLNPVLRTLRHLESVYL